MRSRFKIRGPGLAIHNSQFAIHNSRWTSGPALVLYLGAAKLALHLLTARRYGYFRDELYFIDCGKHLDWGYVDLPPLLPAITRLVGAWLGPSLTALRSGPAAAGALKVALAGWIARELGGGQFAQALATLAVLVAPGYLAADHLLTMNAFEPVFWTACALVFIRLVKTEKPRLWLWFGALAGLGLENKYSMFLFGASFVCGLLLARQGKFFLDRWIWLGGFVAFLLFLPNLAWEVHRGFPTLEFLRNHRLSPTNVSLTPFEFLAEQVLLVHPLTCPLWMAGLWYYLGTEDGKPYRTLGWTFVGVLSVLLVVKGRVYYLLPAYPMLLGSGAVLAERTLGANYRLLTRAAQPSRLAGWARAAYVAALVLGGVFLAPFALPVLPVNTYIRYSKTLDLDPPDIENRKLGSLPQLYADMFGWDEMAAAVAGVYHSLPANERDRAAVFANNYGEAGAIDFFGSKYGLPEAICPHQNYFYWGPKYYTGESLILLGHNPTLEKECTAEEQAGFVRSDYSMPDENFPILLCHGLKRPLNRIWPGLKTWRP